MLDFVLLYHLKGHLTKSPNLSRPQFPSLVKLEIWGMPTSYHCGKD